MGCLILGYGIISSIYIYILYIYICGGYNPYGYGSMPITTIFWVDEHPFTSYFSVPIGY